MEGKIDVKEFTEYLIKYMRENDLVLTDRRRAEAEQLKEKALRKKSLTYKEIADSGLWGVTSKSRVEAIAKEQCEEEIFRKGHVFKVHINGVKRIAFNRGIL